MSETYVYETGELTRPQLSLFIVLFNEVIGTDIEDNEDHAVCLEMTLMEASTCADIEDFCRHFDFEFDPVIVLDLVSVINRWWKKRWLWSAVVSHTQHLSKPKEDKHEL